MDEDPTLRPALTSPPPWPDSAGRVAGFARNRWPDSPRTGGRIPPEWVAGFNRNQWPNSARIRRLAKSSVSRRFIGASAHALRQFHERRHDDRDWLVLLLDGKSFADDQVVIALGVTVTGEKRVLGLVQTATENKRVCATFLRELVERGFRAPTGLLVVLDGAKGLRAAVRDVFGEDVPVQRCQWHKRENVVSDLTKPLQILWRRKLQAAYAHASYADAKRALQKLVADLSKINESAARSLEEASGNADAASAERVCRPRHQFQDDESDRKRDGACRGENAPRGSLAHE